MYSGSFCQGSFRSSVLCSAIAAGPKSLSPMSLVKLMWWVDFTFKRLKVSGFYVKWTSCCRVHSDWTFYVGSWTVFFSWTPTVFSSVWTPLLRLKSLRRVGCSEALHALGPGAEGPVKGRVARRRGGGSLARPARFGFLAAGRETPPASPRILALPRACAARPRATGVPEALEWRGVVVLSPGAGRGATRRPRADLTIWSRRPSGRGSLQCPAPRRTPTPKTGLSSAPCLPDQSRRDPSAPPSIGSQSRPWRPAPPGEVRGRCLEAGDGWRTVSERQMTHGPWHDLRTHMSLPNRTPMSPCHLRAPGTGTPRMLRDILRLQ